jgi:DNA primase
VTNTAILEGLSGRTLDDNIKPKYKNSIDTWFYKKSELLYNLHEAKKTRRETKTVVLVEGFTDVDTLKSAGVFNCVASCGTSLTEAQAKLLSKYFTKIVVMYDNDKNKAGQKAAFRALDILLKCDLDVDVVWLPSGQDPKSYIENGLLLKDLKPHNFILEKSRMIKKCTLELQLKKIPSLFDTLNCISSNIKKEMYVNEVAKVLELKHFKTDFENYINSLNPKQNKATEIVKNIDSGIDILSHKSGQKHLERLRKVNQKAIENTIAIINNTNSTSELLNIFKRDLMRFERYKFLNNE